MIIFKKSLSESEVTEDIMSHRLPYLTTNDKFKNKPTNGKYSFLTVHERPPDQDPPDTSANLIPCTINCKTTAGKEKLPSKNRPSNKTDPCLDI